MPERARVFVCYHESEDEDRFAARLVEDLEAAGYETLVNSTPDNAEDFVSRFREGVPRRRWFVFIMTPAAVASPWTRHQVNAAISEITAGDILPLVMQPCPEQEIPLTWLFLQRIQGYDATQDYNGARDRLLAKLKASLAAMPLPGQAAPGDRPIRQVPTPPGDQHIGRASGIA